MITHLKMVTSANKMLCDEIKLIRKRIFLIYTSSIQATENNAYGISKRKAEGYIFDVQKDLGHLFLSLGCLIFMGSGVNLNIIQPWLLLFNMARYANNRERSKG